MSLFCVVGELIALLEQVEDLGVGGRAVLVGSAAAEAALLAMPDIGLKKLVETRLSSPAFKATQPTKSVYVTLKDPKVGFTYSLATMLPSMMMKRG